MGGPQGRAARHLWVRTGHLSEGWVSICGEFPGRKGTPAERDLKIKQASSKQNFVRMLWRTITNNAGLSHDLPQ
jgi:hypothetical protein